MTTLTFAAFLQASILAANPDSYVEAHREAQRGTPMVVMVTADWCSPCQQMKKTILPQVRKLGLLEKVAFAMVNVDRDRPLAKKLIGGGPVPQLIMYRKTASGWRRRGLVGGQSVRTVEKFINEGLVLSQADQDAEAASTDAKQQTQAPEQAAKAPKVKPVSRQQ
ncbi:MAG: thioredoxin family protein [Pirellulales bacterium]|nr:thioredoxin family protein [Pirellulales bacterium]